MIRVGVTGGIGSGKSTVCRLFAERGVPVYDSDSEAKRLMGEDPSLRAALVEAFGDETFRDGVLNRRYLAATVFGDRRALARLEALVHPCVKRDFERWAAERIAEPYVVLECAILYESGMDAAVDRVVAVVAPEELSQPIGYLCDLEGFSPVEETVEGGFSDEMLVLCGLSGPQLDALLSSLRRSRVVVALKAVVTEDNAAWSSLQLHDELRQEHEAMKGTRPKDAEKRSAHRK